MTRPSSKRIVAACCGCLLAVSATGAEINGYLLLGEAWTDNVTLAPDGQEEDDFITRVKPGIVFSRDGQSLDFDIDYYLEALFYASDSDRNGVYNTLESNATLNVIGEQLQLRGQAAMTQVNIEPEDPVTDSNIFVTNNRTDATIWDVGPLWRRPLIGRSEIEAYYLYGQVVYDDPEVQDAERQNARVTIRQQPEVAATLDYELVWSFDEIEYEDTLDRAEVQELYLELGYRAATWLRLTALGGLDSDFRDPNDSSLSEPRWEVGFEAEFNDNLVSAGIGERYFGTTYRFAWTRLLGDSQLRISYSEVPGTSDLLSFRQIPTGDPDAEAPPPASGIDRPGEVGRFIRRRADVEYRWTGFKSEFSIEAVWDEREDVSNLDSRFDEDAQLPDEAGYGAGIDYRYLLGTRSTFTANAAWRNRKYGIVSSSSGRQFSEETDTIVRLLARIDYELGLKTSAGIQVRFDRRSGTSGGLQDYDQFLVLAELERKF